jgi:hypothetical protein
MFCINPSRTRSDLHPVVIAQKVKDLCECLGSISFSNSSPSHGPNTPSYNPLYEPAQESSLTLLRIALRNALASKRVLCEHHLTAAAFDWVLHEIKNHLLHSTVQPGNYIYMLDSLSLSYAIFPPFLS